MRSFKLSGFKEQLNPLSMSDSFVRAATFRLKSGKSEMTVFAYMTKGADRFEIDDISWITLRQMGFDENQLHEMESTLKEGLDGQDLSKTVSTVIDDPASLLNLFPMRLKA